MRSLLVATLLLLLAPALAGAQAPAPPANDARAAAQPLAVPSTVRGTTVGATAEPNEPASCLGEPANGVWYAIAAASERDLVLELDAAGDLDADVDVFVRERSQLTPLGCEQTDRNGRLTLDTTQPDGAQLLVRVAPRANSVAAAFTLRVVAPDATERPPGRALAPGGASGTVDRIANPDDAYAVTLRAGRGYRVHVLSRDGCVQAALYGPDPSSFSDGAPVRSLNCDDYVLFTPGPRQGGRYSLRVTAPRARRGALRYRVTVSRAQDDDTVPGLPLRNGTRRRGALRGSASDVVDLYRFAVTTRSILQLKLRQPGDASFDVRVLGAGGRRLACACGDSGDVDLRKTLPPGRYYAVVRSRGGADGRYTLSRVTRTITRLRLSVGGRRRGTRVAPGSRPPVLARVLPGASGPVTFDLERFDPLAGWQFVRRVRATASGGVARPDLGPLGLGGWRVRASFAGTRLFAPSGPKEARFAVVQPLAADD